MGRISLYTHIFGEKISFEQLEQTFLRSRVNATGGVAAGGRSYTFIFRRIGQDVFHLFDAVAFVHFKFFAWFVMTISMSLRNLLIATKHSFCVTKSLVSILLSQKM